MFLTYLSIIFQPSEGRKLYPSSVWGPTCDSMDCICKQIMLPEVCHLCLPTPDRLLSCSETKPQCDDILHSVEVSNVHKNDGGPNATQSNSRKEMYIRVCLIGTNSENGTHDRPGIRV